jgi:hypothetical protein
MVFRPTHYGSSFAPPEKSRDMSFQHPHLSYPNKLTGSPHVVPQHIASDNRAQFLLVGFCTGPARTSKVRPGHTCVICGLEKKPRGANLLPAGLRKAQMLDCAKCIWWRLGGVKPHRPIIGFIPTSADEGSLPSMLQKLNLTQHA